MEKENKEKRDGRREQGGYKINSPGNLSFVNSELVLVCVCT